jgi:hypothetical protein
MRTKGRSPQGPHLVLLLGSRRRLRRSPPYRSACSRTRVCSRVCVRARKRGGVRALVRGCAQRVADNNAGDSVQQTKKTARRRRHAADAVRTQNGQRAGHSAADNAEQMTCSRQWICQGRRSRWQRHACARRCAGTSSFLLAAAASCTMRTLRQLVQLVRVRACFARACACACATCACVAHTGNKSPVPKRFTACHRLGIDRLPLSPLSPRLPTHTFPFPATAGCAQSQCSKGHRRVRQL